MRQFGHLPIKTIYDIITNQALIPASLWCQIRQRGHAPE